VSSLKAQLEQLLQLQAVDTQIYRLNMKKAIPVKIIELNASFEDKKNHSLPQKRHTWTHRRRKKTER